MALSGLAAMLGSITQGSSATLQNLGLCTLVRTEWADGDSFLIQTVSGKKHTVRLYGVDCIELHVADATDEARLSTQRRYFGITEAEPTAQASIQLARSFAKKAADEVQRLIEKPFVVHTAFADARGDGKHPRIYAFVTTSEGKDLAALLVERGWARAFGVYRQTPDGRSRDEYRAWLADLELQAAKRGQGIWARTDWDKLPEERRRQRLDVQRVALALDNRPAPLEDKIDPNTAARDEIMRIPGIGEQLANRIIEHRPYATREDLLRVPGIGPKTLERIKPFLEL